MKSTEKIPAARTAGIRHSVEVRHGRKGLGLMFRRGLHGAKNWVLEPDEDGAPRSPWSKTVRAAVILIPLWIVLSSVTGGPERGGHQTSVPQALFSATLVTLIGLAFLSARERRLGREEPWVDLPPVAEGDGFELATLVDASVKTPTEASESMQVSGPGSDDRVVTPGDIPDVSDQSSHVGPEVVSGVATPGPREGVAPDPFVQARPRLGDDGEAVTQVVDAMHNRRIPGALDEGNPTVSLSLVKTGGNPGRVSLEKDPFSQIRPGGHPVTRTNREGVWGTASATTQSAALPQPPVSAWPLAEVATPPVQEVLFPQVTEPAEVATPLVMATPGPYPVTDEPVSPDWWLTPPDAEHPEPVSGPELEPETVPTPVEEQVAEPVVDLLGHDPDVLLFRAIQTMADASEQDKEAARDRAIEWARREIAAGRQSQRSAGRILAVSKTTIANWLNDDPWADPEDG